MAKKRKGTKYIYKGVTFASSLEANVAYTLDKAGIKWEYEPCKIPWEPQKKTKYYTPDFLVQEPDGTEYFIEAKGYFQPHHKTKMLAVKKQHPDLDIRFIFQNPNIKINKTSEKTYEDWAKMRGYGYIPMEIERAPDVQHLNPKESVTSN